MIDRERTADFDDFLRQQRQRVHGYTTSSYRRYLRRRRELTDEQEHVESRGTPQPSDRAMKDWAV